MYCRTNGINSPLTPPDDARVVLWQIRALPADVTETPKALYRGTHLYSHKPACPSKKLPRFRRRQSPNMPQAPQPPQPGHPAYYRDHNKLPRRLYSQFPPPFGWGVMFQSLLLGRLSPCLHHNLHNLRNHQRQKMTRMKCHKKVRLTRSTRRTKTKTPRRARHLQHQHHHQTGLRHFRSSSHNQDPPSDQAPFKDRLQQLQHLTTRHNKI